VAGETRPYGPVPALGEVADAALEPGGN
jgi:hypothetical protein